tara:strand:+ start:7580 stop:8062 length:483 start_codon:yes stop_codon:yes gene_type:complete
MEQEYVEDAASMEDPLGLNVDLSQVDTSYPVCEAGIHACTVKALEVVPKKDDPSKRNIKASFALTEAAPRAGMPGEFVNAGYVFVNYMPLQQSDNPNAPDFKVGLAKFLDAVLGTTEEDRPKTFPQPSELIGLACNVVVKVEEDDVFGTRNNVGNVLAPE